MLGIAAWMLCCMYAAATAQSSQFTPVSSVTMQMLNQEIFIQGMIANYRSPWNERAPHIVTVKEGDAELPVVFWSDVHAQLANPEALVPGTSVQIFGRVSQHQGQLQLRVSTAEALRLTPAAGAASNAGGSGFRGRPVAIGEIAPSMLEQTVSFRGQAVQVRAGEGTRPTMVTVEDATGAITVVYWSDVADRLDASRTPQQGGVYLITGTVNEHRGNLQVKLNEPGDIQVLGADGSLPGAAPAAAAPVAESASLITGQAPPFRPAAPGGSPFTSAPPPGAAPAPATAPAAAPADAPNAIVVDNDHASGFTAAGRWEPSVNAGFHDRTSLISAVGSGTAQAAWTASLPQSGVYEVSVWYVSAPNRPSSVTYIVTHQRGVAEVGVDQRVNGSRWVPLGTFEFAQGPGRVMLTNLASDGQFISADAVRFVLSAGPASGAVASAPAATAPTGASPFGGAAPAAPAPGPFGRPAAPFGQASAPAAGPLGQVAPPPAPAAAAPFGQAAAPPAAPAPGPFGQVAQAAPPAAAVAPPFGGAAVAPAPAPAAPTGIAPAPVNPFARQGGAAPSPAAPPAAPAATPLPSQGVFASGMAPVAPPAASPFAGGAAAPASAPVAAPPVAPPAAPSAPPAAAAPFGMMPSAQVVVVPSPAAPAPAQAAPAAAPPAAGFGANATRVSNILNSDAGKTLEVAGTIQSAFVSAHGTLLTVDDTTGRISIFVMKSAVDRLSANLRDRMTVGNRVHVSGAVRVVDNRPEIRVTRPEGILAVQ